MVVERGGELIDNLHKTMLGYANEFGLQLEDLTKAPGEIFYHVIDRPILEKYRDGGWRNEVMFDQKDGSQIALIDKHARSMKGSLKAILAGDDDSRVTVYDHRRF